MVVPTLAADHAFLECVRSLERQTLQDVEIWVVDNSGTQEVRKVVSEDPAIRVLENDHNLGFGAAVNRAWSESRAEFLAVINDDATAAPTWLESLVSALDGNPDAGMCASSIRLADDPAFLDSAGMLLCADGSSKQRGHKKPTGCFNQSEAVLFPSGCAAIYRRKAIEETGGFDGEFFLYCEDTDLGLRARWGGWKCLYVPDAAVTHRYSHSAGRASSLKAFYVERNRLFVAVKNFPMRMLWKVPFVSLYRYLWHAAYMIRGRGTAAQFLRNGGSPFSLALLILKAHLDLIRHLPPLLAKRRAIKRRLNSNSFCLLARSHAIPARELAAL